MNEPNFTWAGPIRETEAEGEVSGFVQYICKDSSFVYGKDAFGPWVSRVNVDGSGLTPKFVKAAGGPIASDGSSVYYFDNFEGKNHLFREGTALWLAEGFNTGFIAIDNAGTWVYSFREGGFSGLGRINIATGEVQNLTHVEIFSGATSNAICINSTHVFWIENTAGKLPGPNPASVGRARLDGSELEEAWFTFNEPLNMTGITADDESFYVIHETKASFHGEHPGWSAIGRCALEDTSTYEPFWVEVRGGSPEDVAEEGSGPRCVVVGPEAIYWGTESGGEPCYFGRLEFAAIPESVVQIGNSNVGVWSMERPVL